MEIVFQGSALVEVQKPAAVSFIVQQMWVRVCVCAYVCMHVYVYTCMSVL